MAERRIHFEISGEDLRQMVEDWAVAEFGLRRSDVSIEIDDPNLSVEGDVLVEED